MNTQVPFSIEGLALLAAVTFPGLVSVFVYRLLVGGPALNWAHSLATGFFFTVLNYLLSLPLALYAANPAHMSGTPIRYWLAALWLLLVSPILLPVVWRWLRDRGWLKRIILAQHESAFDYYMTRRQPIFMIIHLKDGRAVGGYWGPGAYASVAPNSGDIYLTAVYQLDAQRRFGAPVPATGGLLIRREEYSFIELFAVPNGGADGQR